ncbi:MFS_1_like domain-containing protein [Caerostris darwini]|uniref:MFS_1_like domain-containing protein n=1 Tax=Caerostris darwini TaxID=1538125 RepID=A0AAV4NML3_9ARAC|nr:MFS_1_like domain-containing protein [Caerostris darwini]
MSAANAIMTFYMVYLKYTGLTIREIFVMHTIAPVAQFLSTACLAVVTDKIGKENPILVLNLILSGAAMMAMVQIPCVNLPKIDVHDLSLNHYDGNMTLTTDETFMCETFDIEHCETKCLNWTNLTSRNNDPTNISIVKVENDFKNVNEMCSFYVNNSIQLLDLHQEKWNDSCKLSCWRTVHDCSSSAIERYLLVLMYGFLVVIFMVTYSNCYRFLDVTSAYLVKKHNADYGRIRFWGIVGALVGPSLAGLVVELSTNDGGRINYPACFYLYGVLCFLTASVVFKVDVRKFEEGTKLFKKTLTLAKSPDVFFFF